MSYIQLFIDDEAEIPIGDTTPKVLDRDLGDEALSFVRDLITAIDDLEEDKVLIIRKVIF